jgi:hypothetical protein
VKKYAFILVIFDKQQIKEEENGGEKIRRPPLTASQRVVGF